MGYHIEAERRSCSVLDLMDLQGRWRPPYISDGEFTYLFAYRKIINKGK